MLLTTGCTKRATQFGFSKSIEGYSQQALGAPGGPPMADAAAVTLLAQAALPTRFGTFQAAVFDEPASPNGDVMAVYRGSLSGPTVPLVRLHSECLTGDVLGSMRCDCGQQLVAALRMIAEAECGVLLYLPQEGR